MIKMVKYNNLLRLKMKSSSLELITSLKCINYIGNQLNKSNFHHYSSLKSFSESRKYKDNDYDKNLIKEVQKLNKIIDSELKYEVDNYKPIKSKDLSSFLENSGFKYSEKGEFCEELYLKKSTEKYDVTIIFKSREPLPHDDNQIVEDIEEILPTGSLNKTNILDKQKMQEEELYEEKLTTFNILIQKKGTNDGFNFKCNYKTNGLEILNIYVGDNAEKVLIDDNNLYDGPKWKDISDNVKEQMLSLLNTLSINPEMIRVIEILAVDKDQRLYMKFLHEFKTFFTI